MCRRKNHNKSSNQKCARSHALGSLEGTRGLPIMSSPGWCLPTGPLGSRLQCTAGVYNVFEYSQFTKTEKFHAKEPSEPELKLEPHEGRVDQPETWRSGVRREEVVSRGCPRPSFVLANSGNVSAKGGPGGEITLLITLTVLYVPPPMYRLVRASVFRCG